MHTVSSCLQVLYTKIGQLGAVCGVVVHVPSPQHSTAIVFPETSSVQENLVVVALGHLVLRLSQRYGGPLV